MLLLSRCRRCRPRPPRTCPSDTAPTSFLSACLSRVSSRLPPSLSLSLVAGGAPRQYARPLWIAPLPVYGGCNREAGREWDSLVYRRVLRFIACVSSLVALAQRRTAFYFNFIIIQRWGRVSCQNQPGTRHSRHRQGLSAPRARPGWQQLYERPYCTTVLLHLYCIKLLQTTNIIFYMLAVRPCPF